MGSQFGIPLGNVFGFRRICNPIKITKDLDNGYHCYLGYYGYFVHAEFIAQADRRHAPDPRNDHLILDDSDVISVIFKSQFSQHIHFLNCSALCSSEGLKMDKCYVLSPTTLVHYTMTKKLLVVDVFN